MVLESAVLDAMGLKKMWSGYQLEPTARLTAAQIAKETVANLINEAVQKAMAGDLSPDLEAKIVERAAQLLATDSTRKLRDKLAKYKALAKE